MDWPTTVQRDGGAAGGAAPAPAPLKNTASGLGEMDCDSEEAQKQIQRCEDVCLPNCIGTDGETCPEDCVECQYHLECMDMSCDGPFAQQCDQQCNECIGSDDESCGRCDDCLPWVFCADGAGSGDVDVCD